MALLDAYLPNPDVVARYELRVSAPSEVVWEALHRTDFSRARLIRWLLRLRGLGWRRTGPLTLASFERSRFATLESERPIHVVLGILGRFWRPTGQLQKIDRESFLSEPPAGFARAAWSFELGEQGDAGTRLVTETRVLASDVRSRKSFLRYWRLVGPLSGSMRRAMLKEVAREAEGDVVGSKPT